MIDNALHASALPDADTNDWLRLLGLDGPDVPDLGWMLPEPEQDLSWLLNTHAPTTPLATLLGVGTTSINPLPSDTVQQSPSSVHGIPPEYRDAQTDNSPWVREIHTKNIASVGIQALLMSKCLMDGYHSAYAH